MAKKAGIALAYHAITNRDKVGLIVFESEVKDKITPTLDFGYLVQHITQITPSLQTDFTKMITNAHELFDPTSRNKHIIILTDALPTVGKEPEKETIHAISEARTTGITISIIGINLDKKGMQLAKEISKTGNGRFYTVQQLNELQTLMIQEYYETAQN
jgi:Mg-chelatase subunit ChlD